MATVTTGGPITLRIGERRLPVVLPSWGDPRLHTAAIIVSIHVIGITALGFRVSVPQLVSAILAAAMVDVLFTLRRTGSLVWPASGMLTGSGVGLILRLAEMEAGAHWSWTGWHIYALVAGLSVVTKYVIRHGGSHLFNPSNVGLVAAFLLLGASVVEPLDLWWAPLDVWMVAAYLIILGGGIAITRRLALLEMAVVFWLVLAAGLGVLASSGHCMIATWAPEPVCGSSFWWVLVTSPEILVFLFFMITDPKTIPAGRVGRVAFAATLALLATVLIAPQTTEFGAKVALLGSLVILSPARAVFDRLVPTTSGVPAPATTARTAFLHGAGVGAALVVVAVAIVVASLPARPTVHALSVPTSEVTVEVDPSRLPEVTVEPGVGALNTDIDPAHLAVILAENLIIEGEAVRQGDGSLLAGSNTGERLVEMQRRVDDAISHGRPVVTEFSFNSLVLDVADTGEAQSSAALSFEATGTQEIVTLDRLGAETARATSDFSTTFVLRRVGGDRWLIASVVDS